MTLAIYTLKSNEIQGLMEFTGGSHVIGTNLIKYEINFRSHSIQEKYF